MGVLRDTIQAAWGCALLPTSCDAGGQADERRGRVKGHNSSSVGVRTASNELPNVCSKDSLFLGIVKLRNVC